MGHKVHPTGFRLGVIKDWQSKWYSESHYAEFVQEDNKLREHIKAKYPEAGISLVEIDRQAKDVTITLHTARPGIVIGRGGSRVDEMRQHLEALIGKKIRLNIQEIRQPELDAYLVARSVAEQIERRVAYRRAMKQAIFRTIQSGAKGIKVSAAGRLANAEIARRQTLHEGQVPLHTLRADIDYGFTEAHTTLGRIGVKVWIYKGQVLPEMKTAEAEAKPGEAAAEPAAAVHGEKPIEVAIKAATEGKTEEKLAKATKFIPAEAPEEKPAKAVKAVKAAPVAEPEEKLAKAVKAVKVAPVAEPEEKPAKAVKAVKVAPVAEPEEKPAKPRVKKAVKKAEEKAPEDKVVKAKAAETKSAEKEPPAAKKKRKTTETAETVTKTVKKTKNIAKNKEEDKDATA
ncbi:MAG: 30S ribosomal protein S3 [Chloroflexi bacterium RBG_16_50_11]|nr:MAG: 30S ribosomal protein S3 [Chloroflexi bacterium RBG_16_50_11]